MSEEQTQAIAVPPTAGVPGDMYSDGATFNHLLRVGKMFASSPLVPEHLRKGGEAQAVANCTICLAMARELGENPIVVMQNIHFVSGKFGWSASYMIARANRSGKFKTPINWRIAGKGDSLSVTAFAVLQSGEEVSTTCDMGMAKAEGWTKNPKYQTMPEVMLRYRSAAFLVRFYCPEVMLGYHTADELEDVAIREQPVQIRATADPVPEPAPTPETDLHDEAVLDVLAAADRYAREHEGVLPDGWPSEEQIRAGTLRELSGWLSLVEG